MTNENTTVPSTESTDVSQSQSGDEKAPIVSINTGKSASTPSNKNRAKGKTRGKSTRKASKSSLSPEAEVSKKQIEKLQARVDEDVYRPEKKVATIERVLTKSRKESEQALFDFLYDIYKVLDGMKDLPEDEQKAVISSVEYLDENNEPCHYEFSKNRKIPSALVHVVFAKRYNASSSRQSVKDRGHSLRLALHQKVKLKDFDAWLRGTHELSNGDKPGSIGGAAKLASETLPELKKSPKKLDDEEEKKTNAVDAEVLKIKDVDAKGIARGLALGKPASVLDDFGIESYALIPIYAEAASKEVYLGFQYANTDRDAFLRFMKAAEESN